MAPTDKNSLCQFWNDSNQNRDVPKVLQRGHWFAAAGLACSSL